MALAPGFSAILRSSEYRASECIFRPEAANQNRSGNPDQTRFSRSRRIAGAGLDVFRDRPERGVGVTYAIGVIMIALRQLIE